MITINSNKMIKLLFQRPYLSLTQNENYELEDFSVITGVNGSGKTHLLQAIETAAISIENIDQSAITYYNYSDFNIFEGNPSQDSNLKAKEDFFKNKSLALSQNLTEQRQALLDNYKIWDDSLLVPIDFFDNDMHIDSLDWNDDDIKLFQQEINKNSKLGSIFLPNLGANKNSLINFLDVNIKDVNIKDWLCNIKILLIKNSCLNLLKNNTYNIQITNWDNSEIEKYNLLKKENSEFEIKFSFTGMQSYPDFNEKFITFMSYVNNTPLLSQAKNEIGIPKLKEYIIDIYNNLKEHFKNNLSKDYLNLITLLNGEENLFADISVDDGFLSLQKIADEEKQYQNAKIQNEFNQYKASKGTSAHFYTDEDFTKFNGYSPVQILNEVLSEYDCNGYEFKPSDIYGDLINGTKQQMVSISLFNKKDEYYTNLNALSSGEKTIIALSFYLYKLQKRKIITRLLLLDEVDSALHPSMSKRLLDVLYNIFYKKMGIKIIITTHSPSTVALTHDSSIFIMDKYSSPKISKVSKDKALKELTIGVPSFSVNYENRRQVFVESEYDANYYENLYNIYNDKLNPEISLNFISSGKTKINGNGIGIASCDQVTSIVNTLREAGNNFSWGIIDWDLKNTSSEYIKVLGDSQRYSIENYLLDPLLLAILLWKENILKSEDFGFEKNEVYFNILNFSQTQLQQIINKIISDLNTNRKNNDLSELENYSLCNGVTLQIPAWYCRTQGHSLEEDIIMKTYPQLESIRKKDESALKKAIINKVILNFKDLSCADLLDIFKKIQED